MEEMITKMNKEETQAAIKYCENAIYCLRTLIREKEQTIALLKKQLKKGSDE